MLQKICSNGRARLGGAALLALALLLAPAGRMLAADFIRGDANSDGAVTISDSFFILGHLFMQVGAPSCISAMDVDDNERIELTDAVYGLQELFLGGQKIPSPYPAPGPDPTVYEAPWGLRCESYGSGTPADDPAAVLKALDATAAGGSVRVAVITIALSNTLRNPGYTFDLRCGALARTSQPRLRDLTVPLTKDQDEPGTTGGRYTFGFRSSRFEGEVLRCAALLDQTRLYSIPAGDEVPVVEVYACLAEGTPAGTYPLELLAGELISEDGRAIQPLLEGGTLTVLKDVGSVTCDPKVPPPPPHTPAIQFKLAEVSAVPGGSIEVPFSIMTNRATSGFSYSARFDEALLRCTGTRRLWDKPDGMPYDFEKFEWSNLSGYAMGAAVFSLTDTGEVLPLSQEVVVLGLQFQVIQGAPTGPTPLEFRDGGIGTGGQVFNKIISGGKEITPDMLSDSFVLINGRVNILPDVTPFRKGDTNGDRIVDVSDAIYVLSYLYLGGSQPASMEAADYNEDGRLDLSDAVSILDHLFLGGR